MTKAKKLIIRVLSLVIGAPVLILGIILIPLPGPGILISLLGLYILSQGFEYPKRYLEAIQAKIAKIIQTSKDRAGY